MPPAARIADPTTHGAPLAPGPGSPDVLIGGMPAWRALSDTHMCPAVSITGPDGAGMVMMGSPTVFINFMMAARMGDIVMEIPGLALGPVNPIVMGCPTVIIGESGAGSPQMEALLAAAASGVAFCADCGGGVASKLAKGLAAKALASALKTPQAQALLAAAREGAAFCADCIAPAAAPLKTAAAAIPQVKALLDAAKQGIAFCAQCGGA